MRMFCHADDHTYRGSVEKALTLCKTTGSEITLFHDEVEIPVKEGDNCDALVALWQQRQSGGLQRVSLVALPNESLADCVHKSRELAARNLEVCVVRGAKRLVV